MSNSDRTTNTPSLSGRLQGALPLVILGGILATLGWSYLTGGLVAVLLAVDVPAAVKVEHLRTYFHSWGTFSPVVYVAMVTAEVVVAPIPGTLLYLPGGAIFGGWWGGTLALAGNVLGAGIACQVSRRLFGRPFVEKHLSQDRLSAFESAIHQRGWLLVVLLRINPLTSSDLVSYAAGLTRMPVVALMSATAVGMAPLCYAQAFLSQQLFQAFPWLIWPLVAIGSAYIFLLARLALRTKPAREATEGLEP